MRYPASFRGVSFIAETSEQSGGNRIDVQELVRQRVPATDSLGGIAKRFRLRAIIAGDGWAERIAALKAALEDDSPGVLIHPRTGSQSVRPGAYTLTESTRDQESASFDCEFVEAGTSAITITADTVGVLDSAIATVQADAANAYADALQATTNTTAQITATTTFIRNYTTQGPFAQGIARVTDLAFALADLDAAAATLAAAPLNYAEQLQQALGILAELNVLRALTSEAGTPTPASPSGASLAEQKERNNEEAIRALFIQSALAVHAATLSSDFPTTRPEALEAIAELSDRLEAEGMESLRVAMLGDAVARAQALPELVAVDYGAPVDWLSESMRLYGTPDRAVELASINDTPHPLFVFGANWVPRDA